MEEVWRTRIIPAPIEFASFISIGGGREGAHQSAPRPGLPQFDKSDPVEPRQPALVRPREVIE